MNRRTGIKTLLLLSAATGLLPSCLNNKKEPALSLKHIKVKEHELALLSSLNGAIIPNQPIGTNKQAPHLFILMMVDECMSPAERDSFMNGLESFDTFSQEKLHKSFAAATAEEQNGLLKAVELEKEVPAKVVAFYSSLKQVTIQTYTGSEYYLTKVQPYKLVPGKYYGCVPVKQAS